MAGPVVGAIEFCCLGSGWVYGVAVLGGGVSAILGLLPLWFFFFWGGGNCWLLAGGRGVVGWTLCGCGSMSWSVGLAPVGVLVEWR